MTKVKQHFTYLPTNKGDWRAGLNVHAYDRYYHLDCEFQATTTGLTSAPGAVVTDVEYPQGHVVANSGWIIVNNSKDSMLGSEYAKEQGDAARLDLEPIEALIPDAATEQNQLADKAFVNSSIATATADYKGSYNVVSDLNLEYNASRSQIATALASAISGENNNDYCYVQVPTSDATPTEIASVDRYKYNGTAWLYEYTLNNTGFTAAQWAAINSTITSGLVTKLSALPTAQELTTAFEASPEYVIEDPAETDLVDQYTQLLQTLYQAITDAQNAKADYVGNDYYVYRWNPLTEQYVKTNLYCKGADGAPGTTDYNQLVNKPTNLSDFTDNLGSHPTHTHAQYLVEQDIADKAEKSEMSVTPGTGGNADKTIIQLKSGTTAIVLTAHQDISGKADKSELIITPGSGTDADKTTIQLKSGTSATVLTQHQDISNDIEFVEDNTDTFPF